MIDTTTIRILQLLREGGTYDWADFVRATGYQAYTDKAGLRLRLVNLRDAGLITLIGETDSDIRGIQISPNWAKIQSALGISLKELSKLTGQAMIVEPCLGKPSESDTAVPEIFVAMPFDPALRPVYEDHIQAVATRLGMRAGRADDFFSTRAIMADVWEGICGARAIIADCTGRNPNVFYEVGLAHALGKSVVLIAQREGDIPFDLRYLRFIEYDHTPSGMEAFEKTLRETLATVLRFGTSTRPIREQQQEIQRRETMAAERRRSLAEGERIVKSGLACPICDRPADVRAVGNTLFICDSCGRSFRIDKAGKPFDPLVSRL